MNVKFFEPPAAQKTGGLELAIVPLKGSCVDQV